MRFAILPFFRTLAALSILTSFASGTAEAQYAGTWRGTMTPVVDTCDINPKVVKVRYRISQSGKRLTVRVVGQRGTKTGLAYKNSFSFSSGDYDRLDDVVCLRRYLWQFNRLTRKKADHIYVSTLGCSNGDSCVAAWRGTVTR